MSILKGWFWELVCKRNILCPAIVIEKTTFEEYREICEQICKEKENQHNDEKKIMSLALLCTLYCVPSFDKANWFGCIEL